jgi:hypothetical protein
MQLPDGAGQSVASVITAASTSILGLVALMIVVVAGLAFYFFREASDRIRIGTFATIFAGVVVFIGSLIHEVRKAPPAPNIIQSATPQNPPAAAPESTTRIGEPGADPARFRVQKVSGDQQVVQPGAFGEFSVKVLGNDGQPVSGARILWQTVSFHDDSAFVTATDSDGLTVGPSVHAFTAPGQYSQTASVIAQASTLGYTIASAMKPAGPVATFTFKVPANKPPIDRAQAISRLSPRLRAIMIAPNRPKQTGR